MTKTIVRIVGLLAFLAGSRMAQATYPDAVLANSPVQYLRFEESPKSNAGTATDSSGNSHSGTYAAAAGGVHAGNIDTANGAVDRGVILNGTTSAQEYVNLPAFTTVSAPQFSIEMWLKPDSLASAPGTFQALYAADAFSPNNLHFNILDGDKLQFALSGQTQPAPSLVTMGAVAGAWNYFVVTRDTTAGTIKYYLNGQLKNTFTGTVTTPVSIGVAASLGRYSGDTARNFQGSIDEFALYNTALSDAQIADHFGATIPEPSSVALLALGGLLLWRRKAA